MNIGEVVQKIRVAQGLTQAQLAERSGLHQQAIGQMERGTYSVTLRTLEKIASALGVPMSRMLRIAEEGWEQAPQRRRVKGPWRPVC
jgi:XRE family transcriptional regulator, regulator of sulfur utilization